LAGHLDFGLSGLRDTLPPDLEDALFSAAVSVTYTDGQLIQARGDTNPTLSIVKSGTVRMGQIGLDGGYTGMAVLGPGQFFGEFTIFGGLPREFDAFAVGPTVVEHINGTRFDRLLDKHRGIRSYFLAFLAQRLHAALSFVDDLRQLPLPARVGKTLHMMHQSDSTSPSIKVTQTELAEMLGVTRVSINKALAELEEEGLLSRAYGQIQIPSSQKLSRWVRDLSKLTAIDG